MDLIQLTVVKQNGKFLPAPIIMGFAVKDIISPILNNTIRSYFTGKTLTEIPNTDQNTGHIVFEVSESLATIAVMSNKLFYADVINGSSVVFTTDAVVGPLVSVTAGTQFFYKETGAVNLVDYKVSQTPQQIVAQTFSPGYSEYEALISQNAPVGSKTFGMVPVGSIWTILNFVAGDDFSNWKLLSGTGNTNGDIYQATSAAPLLWHHNSEITYDGSPYVVSTDLNGDINPFVDTIGIPPIYTYSSPGNFPVTNTGAYPKEKTSIELGDVFTRNGGATVGNVTTLNLLPNSFVITTTDVQTAGDVDDELNYTPIKIRVNR